MPHKKQCHMRHLSLSLFLFAHTGGVLLINLSLLFRTAGVAEACTVAGHHYFRHRQRPHQLPRDVHEGIYI